MWLRLVSAAERAIHKYAGSDVQGSSEDGEHLPHCEDQRQKDEHLSVHLVCIFVDIVCTSER